MLDSLSLKFGVQHEVSLYFKSKPFLPISNNKVRVKVADEYQGEGVHDCCGKALRDMSKSKENVVEIFSGNSNCDGSRR